MNIIESIRNSRKHESYKRIGYIEKLLYIIVCIMIDNEIGTNVGRFKEGDILKYNWRAKVVIKTVAMPQKKERFRIISIYKTTWIGYRIGNIKEEDGGDVFWFTKA